MRFDIDTFTEITDSLTRNKSRSFLTGFGIFWGIFMLLFLMGGGQGVKDMLYSNFEGFATNTTIIVSDRTSEPYAGFQRGRYWNLSYTDVDRIKTMVPGLETVTPQVSNWGQNAIFEENSFEANVRGIYADYAMIETPKIKYGRFLNDADVLQGDRDYSFQCIERAVRRIIKAGSIPMVMGGDHSISIPVGRALAEWGKEICVIQFDAHLDWTSHVGPLAMGNGSPMRRISELDHIGKMVQIGLRGMGSGKKSDYDDARAYGSKLISARDLHEKGVQYVLDQIPDADAYYITFDIDGYDMSLAPGAASPLPGGITYEESMDLLKAISLTGKVAAMDLVEVAPVYDPTGCTERLAALTMLQVMAYAGKKLHEG